MITDELRGYCQGRCLDRSSLTVPKGSCTCVCVSLCHSVKLICCHGGGFLQQRGRVDCAIQCWGHDLTDSAIWVGKYLKHVAEQLRIVDFVNCTVLGNVTDACCFRRGVRFYQLWLTEVNWPGWKTTATQRDAVVYTQFCPQSSNQNNKCIFWWNGSYLHVDTNDSSHGATITWCSTSQKPMDDFCASVSVSSLFYCVCSHAWPMKPILIKTWRS